MDFEHYFKLPRIPDVRATDQCIQPYDCNGSYDAIALFEAINGVICPQLHIYCLADDNNIHARINVEDERTFSLLILQHLQGQAHYGISTSETKLKAPQKVSLTKCSIGHHSVSRTTGHLCLNYRALSPKLSKDESFDARPIPASLDFKFWTTSRLASSRYSAENAGSCCLIAPTESRLIPLFSQAIFVEPRYIGTNSFGKIPPNRIDIFSPFNLGWATFDGLDAPILIESVPEVKSHQMSLLAAHCSESGGWSVSVWFTLKLVATITVITMFGSAQASSSPFGTPSSTPAFFGTPSIFSTPFSSHTPLFQHPQQTSSAFAFQNSLPPPQPSPFSNPQLTTQMANVAPVPFSLADRDLQTIVDAYKEDPGNPKYAFKHLLFSVTEPQFRVKPAGVSDIMWAEAMGKLEGMESADRERLWPQLVQGFKDLSQRLKIQDEVIVSDAERLRVTQSNVKMLQRHFQADTLPWIQRLKQKEQILQQRLLRVMRVVEALEGKGCRIPLTKGEAELAEKLATITRQLKGSGAELSRRVQNLLTVSRVKANSNGFGSSVYLPGSTKIHDQSLSDLQEVLQQQMEAIARLGSVLKRDIRDMEIMMTEDTARTENGEFNLKLH
ncbi:hypothetical protein VNO78_28478 [Psophocarpus tetragonolobus]|uniref:Nucleoporin Nup54 alpha-helical domain-containing protein n=1 Tax=Psophocarpus tetragonolobus TaxID=3891 RepID=A0AAN9S268_PSOTE